MISILIVEDEKPISELIKLNLELNGYGCTQAYDGMQACDLIENNTYDLMLLDIMLPKVNGFEVMEYAKENGIPVIFLTAKADLDSRVKGLTSGAEDYIVKPFEVVELLARINIVLRRYNKTDKQLSYKNIEVDIEKQQVMLDGNTIELTPKEFELLVFFMRNEGRTLYRDVLYEEIWGMEYLRDSRTLDLHVQRLRKKLDLSEQLVTVIKKGYRLEKL